MSKSQTDVVVDGECELCESPFYTLHAARMLVL